MTIIKQFLKMRKTRKNQQSYFYNETKVRVQF
jgi:hypothetical protein